METKHSTTQDSKSTLIAANIAPLDVIKLGIVSNVTAEQIQQVGIDLRIANDVILDPHSFINVEVMEKFFMRDVFGLIRIRSSLSRLGIFLSSGVYDPGFQGVGGLSLYNFGKQRASFSKGTRVAQIIIFPAASSSVYDGHYNNNNSIDSQLNLEL